MCTAGELLFRTCTGGFKTLPVDLQYAGHQPTQPGLQHGRLEQIMLLGYVLMTSRTEGDDSHDTRYYCFTRFLLLIL